MSRLNSIGYQTLAGLGILLLATGLLALGFKLDLLHRFSSGQVKLKAFPNDEFDASIVQILAHKEKYHGKRVRIDGNLIVKFEGTGIYLTKESAEYGITSNGFAVDFDKSKVAYDGLDGPVQFDSKYVFIEGVFDKNQRGHLSAWQGVIKNVDRIVELKHSLDAKQ